MKAKKTIEVKRIPVSETNVRKAAIRLLPHGSLVSTEIHYVQHVLGTSATQAQIDEKVMAVRSMEWSSIVIPE